MDDCAIEDAELTLMNDEGKEDAHGLSFTSHYLVNFSITRCVEGELYVTSRRIGRGYLKYDSSAFSLSPDGKVTFKTGDIYRRSESGHYSWQGRVEDYIQVGVLTILHFPERSQCQSLAST